MKFIMAVLEIARNYVVQMIIIFLIMAFAASCVERKHKISGSSTKSVTNVTDMSENYETEITEDMDNSETTINEAVVTPNKTEDDTIETAVPVSAEEQSSGITQFTGDDEDFLVQMRKYATWIAALTLFCIYAYKWSREYP